MSTLVPNYDGVGMGPSAISGGLFHELKWATAATVTSAMINFAVWTDPAKLEIVSASECVVVPQLAIPDSAPQTVTWEPVARQDFVELDHLMRQLNKLRKLSANWNSYGAEVPNETALSGAQDVLDLAQQSGTLPSRIDPSAENGIVISFARGSRYSDIECFNNGEMLGVMHDRSRDHASEPPQVWAIQEQSEIAEALARIVEFINA